MEYIVNRGFTKSHLGGDLNFRQAVVPVIGTPLRPLWGDQISIFDPRGGKDIHGNFLPDYIVGYETEDHYITFNHLQARSLPSSFNAMLERGYVALHVVGHPVWGSHTHIAVFRKDGSFISISNAERRGWAIDPIPLIGEGGDEVNLGDTIFQIRYELEKLETNDSEKERFSKLFDDPLETIRHFLRAGKVTAENKAKEPLEYQVRLQNDQLGESQTLLRERTAEVEALKKRLKELEG